MIAKQMRRMLYAHFVEHISAEFEKRLSLDNRLRPLKQGSPDK